MKFQTLLDTRYNSVMLVRGVTLRVDSQGCVETDNPEAIAALKGMPKEWTTNITAVSPRAPIGAPKVIKSAADLVQDLHSQPDFLAKVANFRSAAMRRSYLEQLGYRFTDAELAASLGLQQPAAPQDPAIPKDAPQPVASIKASEDLAPPSHPAAFLDKQGKAWAWPSETMPRDKVMVMAEAFGVPVGKGAHRKTVLALIRKKLAQQKTVNGTQPETPATFSELDLSA